MGGVGENYLNTEKMTEDTVQLSLKNFDWQLKVVN